MKDKSRSRRVTHGKNCHAKCRARRRGSVRVPFQVESSPLQTEEKKESFADRWALPLYVLAGIVALVYLILRQR